MVEDHTHLAVESANQDLSILIALTTIIFAIFVLSDVPKLYITAIAPLVIAYPITFLAIRGMHRLGWF